MTPFGQKSTIRRLKSNKLVSNRNFFHAKATLARCMPKLTEAALEAKKPDFG